MLLPVESGHNFVQCYRKMECRAAKQQRRRKHARNVQVSLRLATIEQMIILAQKICAAADWHVLAATNAER